MNLAAHLSAEDDTMILTVRSIIQCDSFDELPEPPSNADGYSAAVAPLEGGNYYVLEYDQSGQTNRWTDSGVPAVSDREVEITVNYAYTNRQNVAIYELDGRQIAPLRVWNTELNSSEYSGCGTVSGVWGYSEEAPRIVQLIPPEISDLIAMVAGYRFEAYVGEYVTVNFGTIPTTPFVASRTSAKYRVNPDGTMTFADEGYPPAAVPVAATVNGRSYATLEEALSVAGPSDFVTVMNDVQFYGDLTVNCGILDLNGHYVDPMDFCGTVYINSRGIYSSGDQYWRRGVINAITQVNVSLDLSDQQVELYQVVIGAPEVKIVTRYPISYCSAFSDAYEVVMNITDDGCYAYSLLRTAPEVNSEVLHAPHDKGLRIFFK